MDYQKIIESFFTMLGRFDFDKAKAYIDGKRDILQRLAPTFPNQLQLMTMLTTFNHLAEVEKHYHNQPYVNQTQHHSFLSTTNFLRKAKSLKEMYNDIYLELQQLEQMESSAIASSGGSNVRDSISSNQSKSSDTPMAATVASTVVPATIIDHKQQQSSLSRSSSTAGKPMLPHLPKLPSKQSMDSTTSGDQQSTNSSSTEKDSPVIIHQVPQSPSSTFRNSFFRVLSPISSSAATTTLLANQSSSSSSLVSTNTTTNHNSSHHFSSPPPLTTGGDPYSISSNSGYEPPPNSTTTTPVHHTFDLREFSDELMLHFCRQLQNFIQARLDMIDVYEKLTEAFGKKYTTVDGIAFRLSMLCRQYHKYFHHPLLAPIKEGMTLECESLMTLIRATIDMQHWRFLATLYDLQDAQSKLNYWAASTFNKETTKRRFKVSKNQTASRLYEWLCRFKEFLIAKFTLYFHITLSKNFPPTNFKSVSSKLSIDYYGRLTNFQRKIDALFVALMYDVSNEKDFRGVGYYFPSKEYQQPQGKNTLQPMVVIPGEGRTKLNSLQAEIYMIVMTNQQAMIKDGHYQFHDNIKKLTYSITKLDPNVVLVIVCEGQRLDREATVRSFSLEITNQFSFMNLLANW